MSQGNVAFVRSICAAWKRGDYSATEWAHPEIEVRFADGPAPGSSRLVGMAEAWREFLGSWVEFHQEAEEYRELDLARVLVHFRFSGRGKTSGLDLRQMRPEGAGLFHIREGNVTRFTGYLDRERALGRARPGSRVFGVGDVAGDRRDREAPDIWQRCGRRLRRPRSPASLCWPAVNHT